MRSTGRGSDRWHEQVQAGVHRTLLLVGLLVVTGWGLNWFIRPYQVAREQQTDIARLQLRRSRLRAENRGLERQAVQTAKEEELLRRIREQGMVGDGERRLLFVDPSGTHGRHPGEM